MLRTKFSNTSLIHLLWIGCVILLCLGCTAKPRGENDIIIGTITGPETVLMEVAKRIGHERYNLDITIITFEDYVMPNTALAEGELDANMFQHQPYLDIVLKKQNYSLTAIGKMFIYPMAMYSKKYKQLKDIPDGATIGIPNDPSNAARALRLLAHAHLITLPNELNDLELTPQKIKSNPHHWIIKEMPAAQLPRVLMDLDAAIINTNYALPAKLYPEQDALLVEDSHSPYANIVVVKTEDKDKPKYAKLLQALHSPEVIKKAEELFHHQAIPAW